LALGGLNKVNPHNFAIPYETKYFLSFRFKYRWIFYNKK